MNNSPLKYLDYDVSLLLGELVRKEILKEAKIFHINHMKYINNVMVNKLKIKKVNDIDIIIHEFGKEDIDIANTIYYKSIMNNVINICYFGIISIFKSYVKDYLSTIFNLWFHLEKCYEMNPIIPIKKSIFNKLIQKHFIIFPQIVDTSVINSLNILNNTLGIDKYIYLIYHSNIEKPYIYRRIHRIYFKEWCKSYSYKMIKNYKLNEYIKNIIYDKYFPNTNDYMIIYSYLQQKYNKVYEFYDNIYYFNKIWHLSGRVIGYIYHYNSCKKLDLVDDHRYLSLQFHKKFKDIINS